MKREDIMKIIDGEVYYHYDYTDYLYNIINKAIEYIKENYDNATYTYSKDKDIYCKCFDDLLDILKGEENENN